MPAKKAPLSVHQLKITLTGIDPPVWRRIQVPSTMPLCCLHDAIQAVFGWTDSHLHQFEKDGTFWGLPELYEEDDIDVIDESEVPVARVLKTEGDSLVYMYDFGDDWRHEVVLEKIIPVEAPSEPVCVDGKRKCPPEDVGGTRGYLEFLEVIFDLGNEESDHCREWDGGTFHAEEFNLAAVNEILERMRWPVRHSHLILNKCLLSNESVIRRHYFVNSAPAVHSAKT